MSDDRVILINALERAVTAYNGQVPPPTLLSPLSNRELSRLSSAIESCVSYRAVSGKVVFTGGAGPVIAGPWLATHLFETWRHSKDAVDAVDWLLRMLGTREAEGQFKTAVWGLSIDHEVILSELSRLLPFSELPASVMKSRIVSSSKNCYNRSGWKTYNWYDVPHCVVIKKVPAFPYIGADGACFRKITELENEARDLWMFIQSVSVGHLLIMGTWFEYVDATLDINDWSNHLVWMLPEIHPRVDECSEISGASIRNDLLLYKQIPDPMRSVLQRSMDRFILSQCRHKLIDRILDLILAFEIAVSGPGGGKSVPSFKVNLRSAQLIGGTLDERRKNRDLVSELYELRSKATHGSSLSKYDEDELYGLIAQCSDIYVRLLRCILAIGNTPDWDALELEPRVTT
jgi:hypothetical protein